MNTIKKVRALRKYARKLMQEREDQAMDMSAFYAPAECWKIIENGNMDRVKKVFGQLSMTVEEFHKEADRQIKLEAEGTNMPVIGDWDDVPMAYYETATILEYV